MRKIKINAVKMASRLAAAALAILGFSACSDTKEMYGTPTTEFEVKGAVTDEDGAAVQDAEIAIKKVEGNQARLKSKTTTDSEGKYKDEVETEILSMMRVVCTPAQGSGLEADSVDMEAKENLDPNNQTINFRLKKR